MLIARGVASARHSAAGWLSVLGTWSVRRGLISATAAIVAALARGIPTGVIGSSLSTRMTPVLWWNSPAWAISSLLVGLTVGSYVQAAG